MEYNHWTHRECMCARETEREAERERGKQPQLQNKKIDSEFSILHSRTMCVQIKSHQTSNRPQIGISSGVCVQLVRHVFVRYVIQDGTETLVMQRSPLLIKIFRLTYTLSSNTNQFYGPLYT